MHRYSVEEVEAAERSNDDDEDDGGGGDANDHGDRSWRLSPAAEQGRRPRAGQRLGRLEDLARGVAGGLSRDGSKRAKESLDEVLWLAPPSSSTDGANSNASSSTSRRCGFNATTTTTESCGRSRATWPTCAWSNRTRTLGDSIRSEKDEATARSRRSGSRPRRTTTTRRRRTRINAPLAPARRPRS